MPTFDPFVLARKQIARDIQRTQRMPGLFERKVSRMRASPVGFLRGSAPLFFELCKDVAPEGPPGKGWISGDLHVENFGVYRTDDVVFDLNDFDDALVAPFYLDVLRVITSLVLAARGLGETGAHTAALAEAMLNAYAESAFEGRSPEALPLPVGGLLQRAKGRTRRALLDARTTMTPQGRRFLRDGARYAELSRALDLAARKAFRIYARTMADEQGILPEHLEIVDTAFRIAGTGSLGVLRVAVLARGKAKPNRDDAHWIFDMKAQGTPSASLLVPGPSGMAPAERVRTAMLRCLEQPPLMLGVVPMGKESMLVRRLVPQEDKLNLAHVQRADLEPLARYLGALTGAAHRRGAVRKPARGWSSAVCEKLLARAFSLAGMHEAVYLAYSRLTQTR